MSDVSEKLERICYDRYLGSIEIAEICGISSRTVSNILNGKNEPSPETAIKLAKGLGIRLKELIPEKASQIEKLEDAKTTGEKIGWLLEEKGWTIRKLSEETGLTQQTIKNILSGKNEPRIRTLNEIAFALGTTTEQLLLK